MAPHIEHQQHIIEQKGDHKEYACYKHKKFNCTAYAHKKFGSKFARSRSLESLKLIDLSITTKLPPLEELSEMHEGIAKLGHTTDIMQEQQQAKRIDIIFRPYALGDNTPRKRRQINHIQDNSSTNTQLQQMHKLYQSEGVNLHLMSCDFESTTTMKPQKQLQNTTAAYTINHHNFTLMLQKQQEALYLKNMLQLSGNLAINTLWPTPATMERYDHC